MTRTIRKPINREQILRDYDRGMMRSMFKSLFWVVITSRRQRGKYRLQQLASAIHTDKSEVSRWFSGSPNWQTNTLADIANALDLDIEVRARERSTGRIFAPFGEVTEVRAEVLRPDNVPVSISNRQWPTAIKHDATVLQITAGSPAMALV